MAECVIYYPLLAYIAWEIWFRRNATDRWQEDDRTVKVLQGENREALSLSRNLSIQPFCLHTHCVIFNCALLYNYKKHKKLLNCADLNQSAKSKIMEKLAKYFFL